MKTTFGAAAALGLSGLLLSGLAACSNGADTVQVAQADCQELARILRETTPGEVGGSGLSGLVEVGQDYGYLVTHPSSVFSEDLRGSAWHAYHDKGC